MWWFDNLIMIWYDKWYDMIHMMIWYYNNYGIGINVKFLIRGLNNFPRQWFSNLRRWWYESWHDHDIRGFVWLCGLRPDIFNDGQFIVISDRRPAITCSPVLGIARYFPAFPSSIHLVVTGPDKAWELLLRAFYARGNFTFVPSRWTKVTPPLRAWAAGMAIHGVLKEAYLASDTLKARFWSETKL